MYYMNENPHGGDGGAELDFSVNTNPLGTPESVMEAARAAVGRSSHYPDPCCREAVSAIAAYEGVPEDSVLCGNGASELIYAFCAAVRPASALEFAPTFSEYSSALTLYGARTERLELRGEEDFMPDENALFELIDKTGPEVIFICNPNNPTGRLVSPALLDRLLSRCREGNIRLFIDECFLELSDGGYEMSGRIAEYGGLFILKAFTKNYGMAGLRLGYCLCSDRELMERMSRLTPPWNVSAPAQAAAAAAVKERGFLEKTRELIARERPWLKSELEAAGLRVYPSQANFLLFYGPEELGRALRRHGIAIRSCANFPGLGPGWYRCAVRTHNENLRLIRALRECI